MNTDTSLEPFLKAFEEFAQAEYSHILQCYQLADPEDDSQADEDAINEACDAATERFFVEDGDIEDQKFVYFFEPEFLVMIWDWDLT